MADKAIRVRFAPSPTGPLHIGGVRTALYNYLFAKKNGGTFILRIEDTDQTRYVEGAEEYIQESLAWLGLHPEEGPQQGGPVSPYRQSERRAIYQTHVQRLVEKGKAYYAFDTPEELEEMRSREQAAGVHTPKYDHSVRLKMKNSLTLSTEEVKELLQRQTPHTVRLKVPQDQKITFSDTVRGEVTFASNELDDKVLLKADGLPTYHLANVVDDHLMEISHVIRGEEWLSSTAHHVLLYRAFDWLESMPTFAHLPLILKPSGKGKLSKRDGAKFGFPVFPLNWDDPKEETTYQGFREDGFLSAATINFLSLLGWNPGNDEEIFSLEKLCDVFDLDKINKSGAQFDYDKAKWFNQQYINKQNPEDLVVILKDDFAEVDPSYLKEVIRLLQPRVTYLSDFKAQSSYFFTSPEVLDMTALKKKYKPDNERHFERIIELLDDDASSAEDYAQRIKSYISEAGVKFGEIFTVLRIWLVGEMSGPDLFELIYLIGHREAQKRLTAGLGIAKTGL